jgi:hypothetical protein
MATFPPAVDLSTQQAVEDAVVCLFVATDERDWATLENCLLIRLSCRAEDPAYPSPDDRKLAYSAPWVPARPACSSNRRNG